jgi:hypothetical protein
MNKISKVGKGEVYSWRPSPKLKKELEAAAKDEGTSVDDILGRAIREWLAKRAPRGKELEGELARRRAALLACAGYYEGDGTSATNERVREVVGDYLEAKYGRRHTR